VFHPQHAQNHRVEGTDGLLDTSDNVVKISHQSLFVGVNTMRSSPAMTTALALDPTATGIDPAMAFRDLMPCVGVRVPVA
jgi:hypothetical protein